MTGFDSMVAWLTAAIRPVGPYPILSLHGEQGLGEEHAGQDSAATD